MALSLSLRSKTQLRALAEGRVPVGVQIRAVALLHAIETDDIYLVQCRGCDGYLDVVQVEGPGGARIYHDCRKCDRRLDIPGY